MQLLYSLAKKNAEAGKGAHADLVSKLTSQQGNLKELVACSEAQIREMSVMQSRSASALKNSVLFQSDLDTALQQQRDLILQIEKQIEFQLEKNSKLYSRQQGIASLQEKFILEERHEEIRQEAKLLDEFVSTRYRAN